VAAVTPGPISTAVGIGAAIVMCRRAAILAARHRPVGAIAAVRGAGMRE